MQDFATWLEEASDFTRTSTLGDERKEMTLLGIFAISQPHRRSSQLYSQDCRCAMEMISRSHAFEAMDASLYKPGYICSFIDVGIQCFCRYGVFVSRACASQY